MNRVMMSGNDGFWARVRTVLGRAADTLEPHQQAEFGFNFEGLSTEKSVEEDLRRGWSEAAQLHVSLCVLTMEMDGFADYFAAYGSDAVEESLQTLQQVIDAVLPREGDLCLRSGRSGFVIVLPDMAGLMARQLASRIAARVRRAGLPHRESHAGHITLSMGLAITNPHDEFDGGVLTTAMQAVEKAQRRGIGRLEIADLRTSSERQHAA